MTLLAQALPTVGGAPTPTEFAVWLGCLLFVAGIAKLGLGMAVDTKKLRERPAPNPQNFQLANAPLLIKEADEMATKTYVEERAARNAQRIEGLERLSERRHDENTVRLKEIDVKLDQNFKAFSDQHVKLRDDVRHDVRGELHSADLKLEIKMGEVSGRFEKATGRFEDVIRSLGRLEGTLQASAAHPPATTTKGGLAPR